METLTLNNKTKIPILGLGVYQANPGKETENAVLNALQTGYRHIDTAAVYNNEEAVGIAIKESKISREEIFVTTKLWNAGHSDPLKAFNESLRKLDLDYVDLYLIHWPVEQRLNSWKILEEIYKSGKAKSIGVSNFTIKHLKELLKVAKIIPVINQVEFSPYLYQKELLNFCNENKIQLEAYSPLTKGHKLNDKKLIDLAKKYNKTSAQILIKWELQHKIVAIPKSTKEFRIKENFDVFNFNIEKEDMNKLDNFNENFRTCWDPSNIP